MKRTISSTGDSVFKMIILVVTVMSGTFLIGLSFDPENIHLGVVFVVLGVLALLLWFAASRKTVQIDEHSLYVSVFRRVVTIPLEEIESVTEAIGGINANARTVTVHFRVDTPFGRIITFSPTTMLTRAPHPIVAKLSAYAHPNEQR